MCTLKWSIYFCFSFKLGYWKCFLIEIFCFGNSKPLQWWIYHIFQIWKFKFSNSIPGTTRPENPTHIPTPSRSLLHIARCLVFGFKKGHMPRNLGLDFLLLTSFCISPSPLPHSPPPAPSPFSASFISILITFFLLLASLIFASFLLPRTTIMYLLTTFSSLYSTHFYAFSPSPASIFWTLPTPS